MPTKNAQARSRMFPITSGAHTLEELAGLLARGLDWGAIAARWGLRPRAGAEDLRFDVTVAWERAGCPGGLPRAPLYGPEATDAAWEAWLRARDDAIAPWLASLIADGVPANHCPTCRCRLPVDDPSDAG